MSVVKDMKKLDHDSDNGVHDLGIITYGNANEIFGTAKSNILKIIKQQRGIFAKGRIIKNEFIFYYRLN